MIEKKKKADKQSEVGVETEVSTKMAELNDETKLKLQRFLSEVERLTKETKELNEKLTIKFADGTECKIQFDTTTGIPYLQFWNMRGIMGNMIKIQFDDMRNLLTWLKNMGLEG